MKVRDVMSRDVVSVAPDEMTSVAARVLARCNVGAVPVCDGKGRVHGLLTDRDIVLRCVAAEREPAKTPVREIMSTRVISAAPEDYNNPDAFADCDAAYAVTLTFVPQ